MSHNDNCQYVEKDFTGVLRAEEGTDPSEFRICVSKDHVEYREHDPVTWYHGDVTIGTRWGNYQTEFFESGRDSKEPVLNGLRNLRDALNDAIAYVEDL